ncbi:hypothetical protein [Salinarchaeum chitinilyticum]
MDPRSGGDRHGCRRQVIQTNRRLASGEERRQPPVGERTTELGDWSA